MTTYGYGSTRWGGPRHIVRNADDNGSERICDGGGIKVVVSPRCVTTANLCQHCRKHAEADAAWDQLGNPTFSFRW